MILMLTSVIKLEKAVSPLAAILVSWYTPLLYATIDSSRTILPSAPCTHQITVFAVNKLNYPHSWVFLR